MGRKPNLERRRERQEAFLAAFAETGVASLAAAQTGIPGPQHYGWLREDADYAERFTELRRQTRELAEQNTRPRGPARGSRQHGSRAEARGERQERFLEAIGHGMSIMAAAREVGIGAPTSHYQWMNSDPAYSQRFRALYESTGAARRKFVAEALSAAAEKKWNEPESRESLRQGQRKRRMAESGALEQAWRQGLFLGAIGEGIPLATAVRDCGITKTIHRHWLEADPEYAAAFGHAYTESAQRRDQSISLMRAKAAASRWEDPRAREEMRAWAQQHMLTFDPAEGS